ncbi:biogenesis of lysosome-related organelles complex 1 subunit 2 [Chironomus tepperi]|uniref:biogenesis of lysosome-related organelles complex 1 subunit 2 n=1 Tax=Chironomus tepperi TaxID=113505 RepID=UPI00391F1FC2
MENSFSEHSRTSSYENLLTENNDNLSKTAKNMFQKTRDYLSYELSSNVLDYELLDKMNLTVAKNIELMKKTSEDIVVTNEDLNQKFRDLEPLMKELEEIETTVNKLENAAYRLDAYTQKLEEKINEYVANKQQST